MRRRLPLRLAMVAAGIAVGLVMAMLLARPRPSYSGAPDSTGTAMDDPIAGEAQVFRLGLQSFAVDPAATTRRPAHPRTLATFRRIRAFPGAPPRVPHGLTIDEHRSTSCATCHDRGGYSQRFGAYAPVTPHPEHADCLQCHVADDALIGVALPRGEPDALCRQCHAAGGRVAMLALDWHAAAWPQRTAATVQGAPPPIPHDLTMRGNCLACHATPGAVAEIRTSHPERADCRGCHVLPADVTTFARDSARGAGAVP